MKAHTCRVCGQSRHETVLSDYRAVGRAWNLIRCLTCGLVSTSPLPDDNMLALHYADGYRVAPDDRSAGATREPSA